MIIFIQDMLAERVPFWNKTSVACVWLFPKCVCFCVYVHIFTAYVIYIHCIYYIYNIFITYIIYIHLLSCLVVVSFTNLTLRAGTTFALVTQDQMVQNMCEMLVELGPHKFVSRWVFTFCFLLSSTVSAFTRWRVGIAGIIIGKKNKTVKLFLLW